ncbi:MAG: DUF1614 domain-containing protein [Candidatus Micrarchaeaceae archaeon]
MISSRTGKLLPNFYGGFYINYIGFIIPLAISLMLLAYLARQRIEWRKADRFWGACIVAVALLSIIFKPIETVGLGTGIDVPLLAFVILWLTYQLVLGRNSIAAPLAYVMVFLTAALSDMLAIGKFPGGITFGGYGILDGDFLLPLVTALSIYFAGMIDKRRQLGK